MGKFDGVIIETTGLADPAPVAQTFFIDEEIQKLYSLDCITAVTDAKYLVTRLDDEKPEGVENEAVEQLAFADRVLLNKVDLVPEATGADLFRYKGVLAVTDVATKYIFQGVGMLF